MVRFSPKLFGLRAQNSLHGSISNGALQMQKWMLGTGRRRGYDFGPNGIEGRRLLRLKLP